MIRLFLRTALVLLFFYSGSIYGATPEPLSKVISRTISKLQASTWDENWVEIPSLKPNILLLTHLEDRSYLAIQWHKPEEKILRLRKRLEIQAIKIGDMFGDLRLRKVLQVGGAYCLQLEDLEMHQSLEQCWYFGPDDTFVLTQKGASRLAEKTVRYLKNAIERETGL